MKNINRLMLFLYTVMSLCTTVKVVTSDIQSSMQTKILNSSQYAAAQAQKTAYQKTAQAAEKQKTAYQQSAQADQVTLATDKTDDQQTVAADKTTAQKQKSADQKIAQADKAAAPTTIAADKSEAKITEKTKILDSSQYTAAQTKKATYQNAFKHSDAYEEYQADNLGYIQDAQNKGYLLPGDMKSTAKKIADKCVCKDAACTCTVGSYVYHSCSCTDGSCTCKVPIKVEPTTSDACSCTENAANESVCSCAPENGAGCYCNSNIYCNSGNCYAGLCESPEPVGMACNSDGNCQSNICSGGLCKCSPPPTQVSCECSDNGDCLSGICTAGLCAACFMPGGFCSGDYQCCAGDCIDAVCGGIDEWIMYITMIVVTVLVIVSAGALSEMYALLVPEGIAEGLDAAGTAIAEGIDYTFGAGTTAFLTSVTTNISSIMSAITDAISNALDTLTFGLLGYVSDGLTSISDILAEYTAQALGTVEKVATDVGDAVSTVTTDAGDAVDTVKNAASTVTADAESAASTAESDVDTFEAKTLDLDDFLSSNDSENRLWKSPDIKEYQPSIGSNLPDDLDFDLDNLDGAYKLPDSYLDNLDGAYADNLDTIESQLQETKTTAQAQAASEEDLATYEENLAAAQAKIASKQAAARAQLEAEMKAAKAAKPVEHLTKDSSGIDIFNYVAHHTHEEIITELQRLGLSKQDIESVFNYLEPTEEELEDSGLENSVLDMDPINHDLKITFTTEGYTSEFTPGQYFNEYNQVILAARKAATTNATRAMFAAGTALSGGTAVTGSVLATKMS